MLLTVMLEITTTRNGGIPPKVTRPITIILLAISLLQKSSIHAVRYVYQKKEEKFFCYTQLILTKYILFTSTTYPGNQPKMGSRASVVAELQIPKTITFI